MTAEPLSAAEPQPTATDADQLVPAGPEVREPSRFAAYSEGAARPAGVVDRALALVERLLVPGL